MVKDKDKKNNDEGGLDRAAFKRAIGMIESSGGKYLDSKYSSAAGKYHFLYNLIKGDPDMKGVSKREFMNNPDLQERIMDKAIDGKLKGYVGYNAHAKNLKSQFSTDLTTTEIAALTHFLGAGGVRKYLRNPGAYSVAGQVNQTPEQYLGNFNKHARPEVQDAPVIDKNNRPFVSAEARDAMQVKRDGTNINTPQPRKDVPSGLQFKQNNKIDISALPDVINDNPVEPNIIPLSEQVQGGTPSGLKVLGSMPKAYGGPINPEEEELIEFNEGGTHEENPHGGIPMGEGENGKMNTVEEGETKYGDYVFSNRFGMGGYAKPNKENSYAEGGKVDPVDGKKKENTEGPVDKTPTKITKTFTDPKTAMSVKEDFEIPRTEVQMPYTSAYAPHMKGKDTDEGKIQKEFIDWYSDPETRRRIIDQGDIPEDRIDDFLTKGIKGGIFKGASDVEGADAEYFAKTGEIRMNDTSDTSTGVHEVVHRSGLDQALSGPLMDILGNSFSQNEKNSFKQVKRYLNQPHEAYGNFAEFRKSLGLKPGQDVTKDQLKKLVKEKGLENENFYRTFDDEKIVKAINTVAYQDAPQEQTEYRLS